MNTGTQMTSLTTIENDAAKVMEFYDFCKESYDEMVSDLNLLYKGKYSRTRRKEVCKNILECKTKRNQIIEYIETQRNSGPKRNLDVLMTEVTVKKMLSQQNYQDEDAIKHWFYTLYPEFTPNEIADRHETVTHQIGQREVDNYQYNQELMCHAEHWLEFYDYNLVDFEIEMARDLYRSMSQFMYDGLTARMCFTAIKSIHGDQTRKIIDDILKTDKMQIEDDELRQALQIVRKKYKCKAGSVHENMEFVKQLFVSNWDEFTVKEIKDAAKKFYFATVINGADNDNSDDISVIEIEDDEYCQPSKKVKLIK